MTDATTSVHLHVNGKLIQAHLGDSVAAALLQAGVTAFRRTPAGDVRAPLCAMGICFECRVTIDGISHQRACLRVVREGMEVETDA